MKLQGQNIDFESVLRKYHQLKSRIGELKPVSI